MPSGDGVLIQSLDRGLRIMETVGARGSGLTLAEIKREVGLHPSTAFHLLRTLTLRGYLYQDRVTKTYRLGAKVLHLAASGWREKQLVDTAAPVLERLAARTGFGAHLAVREVDHAVVIARADGARSPCLVERVGDPRPLHCSASGKALLAFLPESERQRLVAGLRLARNTPRTIVERAALEREIRRIRLGGYAVDDEEFAAGVRCVAAPVLGAAGEPVAAVGVLAPAHRCARARLPALARVVVDAARALSPQLGGGADGAPPRHVEPPEATGRAARARRARPSE
jgi:DNA-binding IclR family transcriptional regulator